MARITIYKNSILANIINLFGYGMLMCGALLLIDGEFGGIMMILLGIGCMFLAGFWSSDRAFRKWWKELGKAGVLDRARTSREVAVEIYQRNPNKKTLKKIRELNPSAAAYIENGFKESVAQAAPVPQQVRQPVQQTSYRTPERQTAYQKPVYQPPVMQQSERREVIRGADGREFYSLDAYIEDALLGIKGYAERDPEAYWKCFEKLEWLTEAYKDNDTLLMHLSSVSSYYTWLCSPKDLKDYRRAVNLGICSLNYGSREPSVKDKDVRKQNLFIHAVHGSIMAGNQDDIKWLEEAMNWLRAASAHRLENPDERGAQYQNVAIPSACFYVGYWLAKACMEQNPPQKQKAKAALEEALQACPYALIRNCDINPDLNTDTRVLIQRESLLALLNQASR